VNRFNRPTVLIALGDGDDLAQGSARSVSHFPLNEALAGCADHLAGFGGHAMAAGIRIRPSQVAAFTTAFLAQTANRLTPADLQRRLQLDDEVHLRELTASTIMPLSRLAPFGLQNARPLLATDEVEMVEPPRTVGATGAHLRFVVRQDNEYRKAIAFNCGGHAAELAEHRRIRLAFEPVVNSWNGYSSIDLKVVDWKACG
jgi:single-stranded-DNA-specific exonuclease